jgi:hypothetical protein
VEGEEREEGVGALFSLLLDDEPAEEFDEDDFILNEPRWRAGLVPMVSVSYKCLTL